MLVFKNSCGPNAKPDRPNAKPGTSLNTSKWNIVRVGYARVGFAYISCCLFPVPSRLVSNANTFSGGIWALHVTGRQGLFLKLTCNRIFK